MKMLVAAAALATLVASPAFAQSYDPDLGSGNITAGTEVPAPAWSRYGGARSAYGRVAPDAAGLPVRHSRSHRRAHGE